MSALVQAPRTVPGRRRDQGAEAGYSTVEAVVILPFLVALTLLVVQFAFCQLATSVAEGAARQGVAAARVYGSGDRQGSVAARAYIAACGPHLLHGARIEVSHTATTVTVTVHAQVASAPGIPFSFAINTHSSAPRERFVPAGAP
jgi:Flp pilus assembly protein TadG